jgi:hypothetical protein
MKRAVPMLAAMTRAESRIVFSLDGQLTLFISDLTSVIYFLISIAVVLRLKVLDFKTALSRLFILLSIYAYIV